MVQEVRSHSVVDPTMWAVRRCWSEQHSVGADHGVDCCCRHFKQRVRETAGAATAAQVHNIRKWLVCMEIHHGLSDAEVGVGLKWAEPSLR
jgi:hypothetical protein